MPLQRGKSGSKGYYSWGSKGHKYSYNSEAGRKEAKRRAIIQAYAIEKSKERRGQKTDLKKSGTGRRTELKGVSSHSKRTRRTGSKASKSGSKRNRKTSSKSRKSGSKRKN